MLRIVLVHAGPTTFEEQNRIQGNLDIPLSEQGKQDACQIAQEISHFDLERIYHSQTEPSVEMADIIGANLDIKVKALDHLQNVNCGLWQGLSIEELQKKQPKVFKQWESRSDHVCPPDGETFGEAFARVQKALSKLTKKHPSAIIGLVVPKLIADLIEDCLICPDRGLGWEKFESMNRWQVIGEKTKAIV